MSRHIEGVCALCSDCRCLISGLLLDFPLLLFLYQSSALIYLDHRLPIRLPKAPQEGVLFCSVSIEGKHECLAASELDIYVGT